MIEFLEHPVADGYGVITIGHWQDYTIQIMPMLFNHRLVMTLNENLGISYDFGWCFPSYAVASIAAAMWDPDTEAEPRGYIKAIGKRTL